MKTYLRSIPLLLLLILAGISHAQQTNYTQLAWDSGTSLPGSCDPPSFYYKTDTQIAYACGSKNSWVQVGNGGTAAGTNGQILFNNNGTVAGVSQVPKSAGGTGTASPALVAGSNITITGTWPNNTITSSGGVTSTGSGVQTGNGSGGLTNNSGLTVDGSGNLVNTSGYQSGSGTATSGYMSFSGATSGASGFAAAAVAGTSILYLMPTSPGSSTFLEDTGVATCPTLPAGSPSVCHQLAFAAPAAVGSMTQIAQTIIGSPAATVTFSSISGAYTNLMVTVVARCSQAVTADDMYMQFNGDTGTNYTRQFLSATTTTVSAGHDVSVAKASMVFLACASALASAPGLGTIQIPSYAGTAFLKVAYNPGFLVPGAGATNAEITNEGLLWASTAAITSITLGMAGGSNFVAGSTFTLYGY